MIETLVFVVLVEIMRAIYNEIYCEDAACVILVDQISSKE